MYRAPQTAPTSAAASPARFAGRGAAGSSASTPSLTRRPSQDDGALLFRRKQAWKTPSERSTSGGSEKKSLLESIFSSSKRRASAAAAPPPPAAKQRPAPSPEAIARGVEILHSIFPKWEPASLQIMLEANEFVMEDTITAVLNMEEAEGEGESGDAGVESSDANRLFPVKNPLPDDFLRVRSGRSMVDGAEETDHPLYL